MNKFKIQAFLLILFLILSIFYYQSEMPVEEINNVFLTLSTFLFALFTGFFISRQATRYASLRKLTADFDGIMSSTYRAFQHYGKEAQDKVGKIIENHYQKTLKGGWDYHLENKSSTLTDIHTLSEEVVNKEGSDGIKGSITTRMVLGLHDAQKIRKNMVALHDERIPSFQTMLIYLLTTILIITVSTIESEAMLLGSLIKSAFIVSIIVVVILLKKLDRLELFSGGIGERSAQDVIDIINNKR